ncbi:mitotic checkpoint serine/threonine-protein kinase BUB1 beta-like [Manacus candei]|uniref:mitotic checkpoint serine/threonine-protein kinase BUB1 beta-like n=1 Tax=Manacus candei TaxID=415023 RepID=UPI002225CC82|nr:mitotic checkpoint serine/threonine-protein kinase BUB1 beta-like [Manacus candei]
MEEREIDCYSEENAALKVERIFSFFTPGLLFGGEKRFDPLSYEAQIRNYQGPDPLEPWDRYAQWAEGCLPLQEKQSLWPRLLEELVKRFLGDTRYQQDPRFIKYCIKLVGKATFFGN